LAAGDRERVGFLVLDFYFYFFIVFGEEALKGRAKTLFAASWKDTVEGSELGGGMWKGDGPGFCERRFSRQSVKKIE
jgi:hypothetical protein